MQLDIRREGYGLAEMQAQMPGIGGLMVSAISRKFATYVRQTVFSGQVFKRITGVTRKSTRHHRMKKGMWAIRPGMGVDGHLNYLNRFERGERPFMAPSFEAFKGSGQPGQIMQEVYNRQQAKILAKAGAS